LVARSSRRAVSSGGAAVRAARLARAVTASPRGVITTPTCAGRTLAGGAGCARVDIVAIGAAGGCSRGRRPGAASAEPAAAREAAGAVALAARGKVRLRIQAGVAADDGDRQQR